MIRYLVVVFMVLNLYGVSIATGGRGGTYYPFGKQIAEVCGYTVGGLDVIETKGSLDNIKRLLKDPDVKFAIVQYDVLLFLKNNPKYRHLANKLKIVVPLYGEDVHVVVRKDLNIHNIYDLEGLNVSVGAKGGGSFITASNIKKYTGINWNDKFLNIKDSLKAMVNHKLDALIYTAGVPAKIFQTPINSAANEIFHKKLSLLDIGNDKNLGKIYSTSFIPKVFYPWLDYSINTKSVKSVLVTYNYKPDQPSYKRVKNLYKCLYKNIEKFKSNPNFHPKWQQVVVDEFNIKWDIHPAVKEFLNPDSSKSKEDEILDNFFGDL
jgi:TRAP transporter TAXI family solute receptor